jgi:hypothetical protein
VNFTNEDGFDFHGERMYGLALDSQGLPVGSHLSNIAYSVHSSALEWQVASIGPAPSNSSFAIGVGGEPPPHVAFVVIFHAPAPGMVRMGLWKGSTTIPNETLPGSWDSQGPANIGYSHLSPSGSERYRVERTDSVNVSQGPGRLADFVLSTDHDPDFSSLTFSTTLTVTPLGASLERVSWRHGGNEDRALLLADGEGVTAGIAAHIATADSEGSALRLDTTEVTSGSTLFYDHYTLSSDFRRLGYSVDPLFFAVGGVPTGPLVLGTQVGAGAHMCLTTPIGKCDV